MTWRRRKQVACHGVSPRVMTLHCDRCGDTAPLETNLIVLEAQVIVFVDAHCAHEGHAVRVRVGTRSLS
ncbi:MAG: hypothetical protein QOI82_2761 [Actinomycetota bacterium]|nr:hypothetical protein [Actinomycetota bacterium]